MPGFFVLTFLPYIFGEALSGFPNTRALSFQYIDESSATRMSLFMRIKWCVTSIAQLMTSHADAACLWRAGASGWPVIGWAFWGMNRFFILCVVLGARA